MPRITIVHADGRYKVKKDGEQIRGPRSTGRTLPVQFDTTKAAEGYVRVYKVVVSKRRRSPPPQEFAPVHALP